MRDRLIRWLGGISMPEEGIALLVYPDLDDPKGKSFNIAHIEGSKEEVIYFCGGVPMPKAGEGQYLRSPAVCKMPVRKATLANNPLNLIPGKTLEEKEMNLKTAIHRLEEAGLPPLVKAIREADPTIEITTVDMTVNLCDTCHVSAACKLDKTIPCNQYIGAFPPATGSATVPAANLCDVCKASAQDCRKAEKDIDPFNNTVKCDQWINPGITIVKDEILEARAKLKP